MAPSNKAPPPDFKRIKAKVGKKAPKPANLTDTAFKAASVVVRSQSVAPTTSAVSVDLISSRGHSIHDLTAQLQHPAQPVRLSAAKGLRDLILHSGADAISHHLSLLLPAVAKCSVDTEETVREVGLLSMKDLLALMGKSVATALTPFGPLLVATVSCAINSMDKHMRRHGAMLSHLVCQFVPEVVRPHVAELLPAFARLLSESKLFEHQDDAESGQPATKKRKTTKQSALDGDFSLPHALLSLILTMNTEQQTRQECMNLKPDIKIAECAGSRNAITLVQPRHPKRRLAPIREVQDISTWLEHDHRRAAGIETTNIPLKTVFDLMTCFRDVLIEASQKRVSTAKDLETLLLLCKSTRQIWGFGRPMLDGFKDKEQLELEKTCRQIGKLILEIFPLESHGSTRALADELNAVLCSSLLALASSHTLEKESVFWIKRVTVHVLSTFVEMSKDGGSLESGNNIHGLRLFGDLVLDPVMQPIDKKIRAKLVMAFCQSFFREETFKASLARSSVGQEAFRLACSLFDAHQHDLVHMQEEFGACVADIVRLASDYMNAWGWDFPSMSQQSLTLLHSVSRRRVANSDDVLKSAVSKLDPLLAGNIKSPFEQLPEALQRLFLSLIIMVGSPSAQTLKDFGLICSRSRRQKENSVLPETASFILTAFHMRRKELPMQAYLTFVMDATGLDACTDASLVATKSVEDGKRPWQAIMSFDDGIVEACRCYIDCGAPRVLQMISPLLTLWLEKGEDSACVKSCELLRLRGALMVIGLFQSYITKYLDTSAWANLPSEFRPLVCQAIANLLCCSPKLEHSKAASREFKQWTNPICRLLETDASLLTESIAYLCRKVADLDPKMQVAAISCMSHLLKEAPELAAIVETTSASLVELVVSLSQALPSDGPAQDKLGQLSARLELISGQSTDD